MPVKPGEGMKLLTDEQLEEYRDAFDLFDRDGNGKVSSDELGPLMRSLGANPNDDHLQELINEVDYDGDGVLNFTEFIDLMINDKHEIDEDLELIEAFHAFDSDDTGFINSADLREAFYRLDDGQGQVEDLIDAANVRVDRKITFDGLKWSNKTFADLPTQRIYNLEMNAEKAGDLAKKTGNFYSCSTKSLDRFTVPTAMSTSNYLH